jgi:hypothetical protein
MAIEFKQHPLSAGKIIVDDETVMAEIKHLRECSSRNDWRLKRGARRKAKTSY